jgi:hypothetical protein
MFSDDPSASAAEIARVTRSGGQIALAAWTEEGGDGDLFRLIGRFSPHPREVTPNPFDWARITYAGELLGGAFDLEIADYDSVLTIKSGSAYWELFSTSFGPLRALLESLSPERRADLRTAWVSWAESMRQGGEVVHHREYRIVHGVRLPR